MVLSDRSVRDQMARSLLAIGPVEDDCIQPSSVDLRLARLLRVFRVGVMPGPYLDVRHPMEGFTELLEEPDDEPTAGRGYQDFEREQV